MIDLRVHVSDHCDLAVLQTLNSHIVPEAFHDTAECEHAFQKYPIASWPTINGLVDWVNEPNNANVFKWVYGPAGVGKSTLAKALAIASERANIAVSSHFFSRNSAGCSRKKHLIPNIVYQLVQSIPSFGEHVYDAIQDDPAIFRRSIMKQVELLILTPLERVQKSTLGYIGPRRLLFLIDGLDECSGEGARATIISHLLESILGGVHGVRILIMSRPEQEIRDAVSLQLRHPTVSKYFLGYPEDSHAIEVYITLRVQSIRLTHPLKFHIPAEWPSTHHISRLVNNASLSFIYASDAMDFISCPRHHPPDRLEAVCNATFSIGEKPFPTIDANYHSIFASVKDEVLNQALNIVRYVILQSEMYRPAWTHVRATCEWIELLLGYRKGDVQIALCDLHSLIAIPDTPNTNLYIYHSSLKEWMFNSSRSGQKFYVDRKKAHTYIACRFIYHLVDSTGMYAFCYM